MTNKDGRTGRTVETHTVSSKWDASQIPDLHDHRAVVTGTGGIGLETALALARAGADVIIAGRNPKKGAEAAEAIRSKVHRAKVRFEQVDLASLASVTAFSSRLRGQQDGLDLLINNAAVMTPPTLQKTADNLELQFQTNYLSHFALTLQLLPLLQNGRQPRVVSLSSLAAQNGMIDFENLQSERAYKAMKAYGQSKLACLMFAFELHRRSDENHWGVASIAAHPGISRTDLLHNAPGRWSVQGMIRTFFWFLFQPSSQGALPSLFAATSPEAMSGAYYGPDRVGGTRGYPTVAKIPPQALDQRVASELWEASVSLAGVSDPSLARISFVSQNR